jgi:Cof subfamily protein (haloacid dehalogenase superfamily)
MPDGPIRLAALDLDGTLVRPDLTISPAVRDAVRQVAARGVVIVLATGRAYPSARRFQAALGVRGPTISHQGAVVRDPDGRAQSEMRLPPGARDAAIALAATRGDELSFYADDVVFLRELRHPTAFYDHWFGVPRREAAMWAGVPDRPTKLLLIAPSAPAGDAMAAAWRGALAGVAIVRSHALFVEGVAADVSKGVALAGIAAALGIPAASTLAVGDNENDASMLAWAGVGVAMGGAPPAVVSVADAVAPTVEEDGAAWALRRFVLGGRA